MQRPSTDAAAVNRFTNDLQMWLLAYRSIRDGSEENSSGPADAPAGSFIGVSSPSTRGVPSTCKDVTCRSEISVHPGPRQGLGSSPPRSMHHRRDRHRSAPGARLVGRKRAPRPCWPGQASRACFIGAGDIKARPSERPRPRLRRMPRAAPARPSPASPDVVTWRGAAALGEGALPSWRSSMSHSEGRRLQRGARATRPTNLAR